MYTAVTFDLTGTLCSLTLPADPAAALARELRERGVRVPEDWADAYAERHLSTPEHAAVPLPARVAAALRSRGVEPRGTTGNAVRRAVVAAFDPSVTVHDGALEAVTAAAEYGPVGVLSNCEASEVVSRAVLRAGLREHVDVTVTGAGCGWRKPHPEAFGTVADRLGVDVASLVHVGDDPATDGGIEPAGGRFLDVAEMPLADLPAWFADAMDAESA